MLTQKAKIILIWLAGLISTDGSIQWTSREKRTVSFMVTSVEKEWLELIKKRLTEIEIDCSISGIRLYIHNPRLILKLFKEADCSSYFNPRKWKRVEESYERYKTYQKFDRFSLEEDKIILEHLSDPIRSYLHLLPNRTWATVWDRKKRLQTYVNES